MAVRGRYGSTATLGLPTHAQELTPAAEPRNRASELSVAIEREASPGQPLTPGCIALGAARLMLRQEERRQRSGECQLGELSVLDSLFVAAGGLYTADGVPAPPEEPAIVAVLTRTVELLGKQMGHDAKIGNESAHERLRQLRPRGPRDSVAVQALLATVDTTMTAGNRGSSCARMDAGPQTDNSLL
jgi:hypothetical protein